MVEVLPQYLCAFYRVHTFIFLKLKLAFIKSLSYDQKLLVQEEINI